MRRIIGTVATVASMVGIVAGPAAATPAQNDPIHYKAEITPTAVAITTDAGAMSADNGVFTIKATDGAILAGTQLSFRVDDFIFPIAAVIHGRTATLTPQFDAAHATYQPVALPFQDSAPWRTPYEREQAAWNRLFQTITIGATIGSLVGGIGGAAVGCVLGGVAGATVAAAAIVGLFGAFIPAAAVGCLGGILAVGALGTLAGQLLITAPVAVMAAIQYFTTINEPMVAPHK